MSKFKSKKIWCEVLGIIGEIKRNEKKYIKNFKKIDWCVFYLIYYYR